MQTGAETALPLNRSLLWEVFAPCSSSKTLRRESKKLIPDLVALDDHAFKALVVEWVSTLEQLGHAELARFGQQTGLCGNDLEFLNLRCAIFLKGREFCGAIQSGQWHLARECKAETNVWIGLSELMIGVLWVTSFERAGNFTFFDQLFSDDDYLRLLQTDFFAQPCGSTTAGSPDELIDILTRNKDIGECAALLSTLEESLDEEDLAFALSHGASPPPPVQEVMVPGLGPIRHGSVLRDGHGEKCWVYQAIRHGSGGVEAMVLRRRGRVATVFGDIGKWKLVAT